MMSSPSRFRASAPRHRQGRERSGPAANWRKVATPCRSRSIPSLAAGHGAPCHSAARRRRRKAQRRWRAPAPASAREAGRHSGPRRCRRHRPTDLEAHSSGLERTQHPERLGTTSGPIPSPGSTAIRISRPQAEKSRTARESDASASPRIRDLVRMPQGQTDVIPSVEQALLARRHRPRSAARIHRWARTICSARSISSSKPGCAATAWNRRSTALSAARPARSRSSNSCCRRSRQSSARSSPASRIRQLPTAHVRDGSRSRSCAVPAKWRRRWYRGRLSTKSGFGRRSPGPARLAAVDVAPLVKQVDAKSGTLDGLQELFRNDLIGIDVLAVQRYDQSWWTVNVAMPALS